MGYQKVSIAYDNEAILKVLTSGRTCDLTLEAIPRNIQCKASTRDIELKVTHIPGKSNVRFIVRIGYYSTPTTKTKKKLLPNYVFVPMNNEHIAIDWCI